MSLHEDGTLKYGACSVLESSRTLSWHGLVADLRRHPAGELPPFRPSHLEIGIATDCHPDCVVARRGNGVAQRTHVEPGIVWLCPPDVLEEDIRLTEWHEVLHIHLPAERFAQHGDDCGGAEVTPQAVRYLAGLHDAEVLEFSTGLLREMRAPTSAGRVLVDQLAVSLTARITGHYVSVAPSAMSRYRRQHTLDERRVRRVLEFMAENLETDIGLDELAGAAALSPFHFDRMFARRMGMPPHRYLGLLRLERAKTLLSLGERPIAEIALACGFSTQSNFARAFRRATGTTPLAYRRDNAILLHVRNRRSAK